MHNRGEGIVALQNVQNPNNWIAIKNGQTVGTVSDVILFDIMLYILFIRVEADPLLIFVYMTQVMSLRMHIIICTLHAQ